MPHKTVVKCPHCGYFQSEPLDEGTIVLHWRCPGCGALVEPNAGDCCVYCSHGSEKCLQAQRAAGLDLSTLGDGAPAREK
jgi:hypothetical protein